MCFLSHNLNMYNMYTYTYYIYVLGIYIKYMYHILCIMHVHVGYNYVSSWSVQSHPQPDNYNFRRMKCHG